MKTILFYVQNDNASEARLQVALDLARAHSGHLLCVQVTPMSAYVATGDYGAVYMLADVAGRLAKIKQAIRADTEARLSRENVAWSYETHDGDPATTLVARSSLADVVVLTRGVQAPLPGEPEPLAGDVAVHASTPVLAVPPELDGFDACGRAFIAWNGSPEAANALKAALPMLRQAAEINIVVVSDDVKDRFPATEACRYLSRHGLKSALREVSHSGATTSERLLEALRAIGGDYVVMGAYGHSRLREFLLGGVTRHMLKACPVPVLFAH